jgi:hypothetical protein
MVTYKGSSRFYSRNSAGKYRMDIEEIRTAFASSELLTTRMREFRDTRLAKIIADEVPVRLTGPSRIVLHMLHTRAFEPGVATDFTAVGTERMRPMSAAGGWSQRINFDGTCTFSATEDGLNVAYTQLFRNGCMEAVDSDLLDSRNDSRFIPTQAYEKSLIHALTGFFNLARFLELDPPWFVMISLLGVRGYKLGVRRGGLMDLHAIDRDTLLLPDLVIEDGESDASLVLRPAFDAVWQAGGLPRSLNYDGEGRWVGQA